MKRYNPDITRVGAWVRPIMTPKSDGAWVSIVELDDWMERHDIHGWYPCMRNVGLGPQLAELERLFREGKAGKMNGVGIPGIDHVHHVIEASRHLDLETSGEERDPDSGALHLVHAAARLLMAAACLERELEVNPGAFGGVAETHDNETEGGAR